MTSTTRQYTAMASHASEVVEKAADSGAGSAQADGPGSRRSPG